MCSFIFSEKYKTKNKKELKMSAAFVISSLRVKTRKFAMDHMHLLLLKADTWLKKEVRFMLND